MISTIKFKAQHTNYNWKFRHNLDKHGATLQAAFINWSSRSPDLLNKDAFCEYVMSKDPINIKCVPI